MSLYRSLTVNAVLSNNVINASVKMTPNINMSPEIAGEIVHRLARDYNLLDNKPQINSVTLIGNKEFEELGLGALTNSEIEDLLNRSDL